jgi:hypothetical protein
MMQAERTPASEVFSASFNAMSLKLASAGPGVATDSCVSNPREAVRRLSLSLHGIWRPLPLTMNALSVGLRRLR